MSDNKIMPWIDELEGAAATDFPARRDEIAAMMAEAAELVCKAEELRGKALLQTLTRFPRLGSCTVKVSCDERFQRTAFYRRGHPMGGALVLSIRHQLP